MIDVSAFLDSLISFPQLSFFKYIIMAAIILVFVDVTLNLLLSAVLSLFTNR